MLDAGQPLMPIEVSAVEWLSRLGCAVLLSGMVGFEREARMKAAGLRTHMLIGFGAALFTLVGIEGFGGSDPSRVAAQIVSGVGFLGAGAIFRDGTDVRGLTTAAGMWGVAAIGMAAGAGLIMGAFMAATMVTAILWIIGYIEGVVRRRRAGGSTTQLTIELDDLSELNHVVALACRLDEKARSVGVDRLEGSEGFVVEFGVSTDRVPTVQAAVEAFGSVRSSQISPAANDDSDS